MADINLIKKWNKDCREFLKGKTIGAVRYLTDVEQKNYGWHSKSLVIFFTDGSFIIPSADDEGNDAGALFTSSETLPIIPVI